MTVALPFVALAIVACGRPAADDPLGATRAVLVAARRGDCATVWSYFSRATQDNTIAWVRHQRRHQQYAAQVIPEPKDVHCPGLYAEARGDEMLVQKDETSAVVSVLFAEGTHFPLIPFLSTPYREWRDRIELVREDGAWKIQRPPFQIGRPGETVVEVGAVDVRRSPGGNPRRAGAHAEAVLHGPRERIEELLMDPLAWPRFVPLVETAEPVQGPDANGGWIWQLHLRASDGSTATTQVHVRPYGRLRKPSLPWTVVQWTTHEYQERPDGPGAPPLYTGSVELREHYEGVQATFKFVIQPDEWPSAFPGELLADTTLARTLTALDEAAAAR